MNNKPPKYQLQLHENNKYDWSALVVDLTGEAPNATTILAKSLPELMAKCLVAVVLHDKNLGMPEPPASDNNSPPEAPPMIFTPNPRIIQGN